MSYRETVENTSTKGQGPTEANPAAVLHIIPRLLPGGAERDAVDIAGAVVEAGARAFVATAGGPLITDIYRMGVKPLFVELEGGGLLSMYRNTRQLARFMRRYRIDIVHVHAPTAAWSAMLAARRAGCFLVTTCRSVYPGAGGAARRYAEVMLRGDRIVAGSDFMANYLRVQYPAVADRIRLIERGVDFARFDPDRISAERVVRLARAWRLPDGVPVVLLSGRFAPEKGFDLLIEAIAHLGNRELMGVLCGYDGGSSEYRDMLERKIEKLRLGNRIHIADDCRDMPAAYMLADVVVAATANPGASGRAVVEARAMGRPVVAIDHGGARHSLDGGQMMWLSDPGDPITLAAAIGRALDLPAPTRARLAPMAIANAAAKFSKEAMLQATLDLYSELLGAHDARDAVRAVAESDPALTPV
jgi:glycosyltransferase involved in cell wall biosynthesis